MRPLPTDINRILLSLLLLFATPIGIHAQFFDFGFGHNPFAQHRQQRQPLESPQFKGGEEALHKFMLKNFQNPSVDNRQIEGRIIVACIINEKGRVTETYIVQSVAPTFDKEAQRVCQKMKFKPAQRGKEKVKCRFDITFPIRHARLSFVTLPTVEV